MFHVPEMILFDYGQTLADEGDYDPVRGNRAVLGMAVSNPRNITPEQLQDAADGLTKDIGELFGEEKRSNPEGEFSCRAFNRYLYEYLHIELPMPWEEVERVFWKAAARVKTAEGIENLLAYLHDRGIRTAVVSNMMKDTGTLTERIQELLPDNHFSFIMASSDYLFRKPHPRIFEMARAKAGLQADQIWYCGDNLVCDVKGAAGVGMKPVWYTPYAKKGQEPPEGISYMTINHWEEVIQLLELFRGDKGICLTVDKADYNPAWKKRKRIAVRGFIRREGSYAMIHSGKYGEYKFPGGGAEPGEQLEDTLLREVQEETGLRVKRESIRYAGRVRETRRGMGEEILEMISYYFACETEKDTTDRCLDAYEKEYEYEPAFVTLEEAITNNERITDTGNIPWILRDTLVMKALLQKEREGNGKK